jgi:folate-binding protein YgfZ
MMSIPSAFTGLPSYRPAATCEHGGVTLPLHFGDPAAEYRAARERVALFDRSDRGLAELTGRDRKEWLHNLVTNTVKTLDENRGVYAFAIDLKGRTLFDLNILNLPDRIWVDILAGACAAALAHLDRYLISEDVRMCEVTERFARLGVAGPESVELAARLGASTPSAMAALDSLPLEGGEGRLVRHDFAGVIGFELIVPREVAADWWQRLTQGEAVPAAGFAALDALRVEAAIPWLGRDIDDKVIPPETGQVERGISYRKGCYLGQEVIERMRSHGSLARRLVALRVEDGAGLVPPLPLMKDRLEAGRITSLVRHPLTGEWIGLGYLRTTVTDTGGLTVGDPPRRVTLVATPARC